MSLYELMLKPVFNFRLMDAIKIIKTRHTNINEEEMGIST